MTVEDPDVPPRVPATRDLRLVLPTLAVLVATTATFGLRPALSVALGAAMALSVSACGGSGGSSGSAKKDAALTSIVNASSKKGGTVTLDHSSGPDSMDPGNTYYGWVQDFSRLYARTLLTFKPAAGKAGLTVVPDLATGLGGTITGEHGVGRLKAPWLAGHLGEDAMELNHRIKQALDPDNILNPGAMYSLPS